VAIVLLVFASAFHWDKNIAEYNIARKSLVPVDVSFLLSLSDEALPIIQKHKEVLANDKYDKFYYNGNYYNAVMFFEYRKKDFFTEQKQYTWLSWNATDAKVKKELSTTPPVSSLK
jgi:pyruvate/2-oxoacid:ferredoxin oxidoreductase alpha subunit